jgi:hypothetical protein
MDWREKNSYLLKLVIEGNLLSIETYAKPASRTSMIVARGHSHLVDRGVKKGTRGGDQGQKGDLNRVHEAWSMARPPGVRQRNKIIGH